ncbi:hypothetical protein QUA89_11870 [Microcoleus sp. F10-B4]|uniref:hypothetical protein n=1 Tax=unclassified Microcoleus TaxID=2642155 RepID=UPI002FD48658
MQNSQVFFVEFGKHWAKVRNNGCFRDLRAIESRAFPTFRQGMNSLPHSTSPLKEDW